jgi:hypothetical protein
MSHFSDFGFKYPYLVYNIWDYYTDKSKRTECKIDFSRFGTLYN